jgi:hypothetical protein
MRTVALTQRQQFYNDPATGRPEANLNLTNFASSYERQLASGRAMVADAVYIQSDAFQRRLCLHCLRATMS